MKNLIILSVLSCLSIDLAYSQQWIDQQYGYDSLLNVEYGSAVNFNGEMEDLQMDIYFPDCVNATDTTRWPLLLWIHGGSFIAGDKNDASIQAYCKDFARRGYVTASINYRLGFISDELNWQCNYPNYSCVFATDSTEWVRAYYRGVQDGKGALRYLVNRSEAYKIDVNNVFVAGESAGAFIALGVGLLDTLTERPSQTFSASNVPLPNASTLDCAHNQGIVFSGDSVARPDLGGIHGDIEPSNVNYTIKGIGNIYGAMMSDLLKEAPVNKPKPAIYSFHQPCDLVVPIDSNYVYWGISWCFTNGYNCFGVANNRIMLYGSRVFSAWNEVNNYGYDIQNEFTNLSFPFNFLFGPGSCLDQVNNPCHAYDNRALRDQNLATFFSTKVTTSPICDPLTSTSTPETGLVDINIYPNPTTDVLQLSGKGLSKLENVRLYDLTGLQRYSSNQVDGDELRIDMSNLPAGLYYLALRSGDNRVKSIKIVKN